MVQLVVPAGHGVQSVACPAYSRSRYVWYGHSSHALDPVGAYLPVEQTVHALVPVGLREAEEIVPLGQRSHDVTPWSWENVPFQHGVHTLESSYVPASQGVHAYRVGDPVESRIVPGGQGWQSWMELLVTEDASRYVWKGHRLQTELPVPA